MFNFFKKKHILIFIATAFLVLPAVATAQAPNLSNANDYLNKTGNRAGFENTDIEAYAGNIIFTIFSFVGVIFLTLMIYGGYLWMTARGNDERVTKAKNLITAAVIGMIVVVGAGAITYFILNSLTK